MIRLLVAALLLTPCLAMAAPPGDFNPKIYQRKDGTPLVMLTARKCLIVEAEKDAIPLGAKDGATCARLSRSMIDIRKRGFQRMRLKAGRYVFRITNQGVPWPVDFALRGAHDKSLPITAKTTKGAPQGGALDYVVDLAPGVYVYSSPMNGTPEYPLLVESK